MRYTVTGIFLVSSLPDFYLVNEMKWSPFVAGRNVPRFLVFDFVFSVVT